jgi:hypothetical protein
LCLIGEPLLATRDLVAFGLLGAAGLGEHAETIPQRRELGAFWERDALMVETVEGEIAGLQREE